jgi:hypothetical protein
MAKKPEQQTAAFNKKQWYFGIATVMMFVFVVNSLLITFFLSKKNNPPIVTQKPKEMHWFLLHRKAQKEFFYLGTPGDIQKSKLLKTFTVKTGIPGERPTPLPKLLGKEYWIITDEFETFDNPETAPYFLTLNIPAPTGEPYGPEPYRECGGEQCSWVLPGSFGLHGTASDSSRLTPENPGSSGCIRHRDEDITYLYNLLDPKKEEIRYYIEDK